MLLLHAFPYDSRTWTHQVEFFSDGWRVLAPDFPGFGGSPAPTGPITFDGLAETMLGQLSAMGVDRAIVAGNSMGGYLAFAMYRASPGFFTGFGIVNSRAVADDLAARGRREALIARARSEGLRFLLEGESEEAIRMIDGGTVAGYIAAQRAIAARPDSSDLLAKIDVPSSVIWGVDDAVVPLAEGKRIAAALPDCVFEPISGAGHVPMLEQPKQVTEAIERLAKRSASFS